MNSSTWNQYISHITQDQTQITHHTQFYINNVEQKSHIDNIVFYNNAL